MSANPRQAAPADSVCRLGYRDLSAAGRTLARAFCDDPLMAYLLPDAARRPRYLGRFMRGLLRYALCRGEVQAVSDRAETVALWLPPESGGHSAAAMLRSGMLFFPLTVGPRCTVRGSRYDKHIAHLREEHVPRPHWFLLLLGTDPEHRRQGHAGRLLRAMLARLDQAGLTCCLDTTNRANLAFYGQLGFEVAAESRLPGTNLDCWLLRHKVGRQAIHHDVVAARLSGRQ